MTIDNTLPPELDDDEQALMEKRLRLTHDADFIKKIILEAKSRVLLEMQEEESSTPPWERGSAKDKAAREIVFIVANENIPENERQHWVDMAMEKWTYTEDALLGELGKSKKEGSEPTIDSGMFAKGLR